MRLDMDKFEAAVKKSRYTMRQMHGSFGGRRRVESWGKRCDPRKMRGVARALGVPVESLCIEETTITDAIADTVERTVDAVVQTITAAPKVRTLSQMNREQLIVEAHRLCPDIDLPDKATKKTLRGIIKELKAK